MGNRFGHAVKDEADTHSGAKQHGKPSPIGDLRVSMSSTQSDSSESTEQEIQAKKKNHIDRQDVKPASLFSNEGLEKNKCRVHP